MKGNISIGRCTGSGKDTVMIAITDEASRITFAEIELSLEDYAKALLGQGNIEGELTVQGLDKVGKTREYKMQKIPDGGKSLYKLTPEEAEELVKPYRVEGWVPYMGDVFNHHRWNEGRINVSFHRYV